LIPQTKSLSFSGYGNLDLALSDLAFLGRWMAGELGSMVLSLSIPCYTLGSGINGYSFPVSVLTTLEEMS